MKDCKIIQDLLPNYIDGLTNEETSQYIENHLKQCAECTEMLETMKKQLTSKQNSQYKEETNYLKKYNRKLNTFKTIVFTIIAIFIIIVIRRMAIFIDIQRKVTPYLSSDNYYIKAYYYSDDYICIQENYTKGNKNKETLHYIVDNDSDKSQLGTFYETKYSDGTKDNYYIENQGHKFVALNKTPTVAKVHLRHDTKIDNFWQLIFMAITSSISTESCNGIECYKINLLFINNDGEITRYKGTEYISKKTGLTMRYIDEQNINFNEEMKTGQILDYKYEFETITDEDLTEPDLSEYEIDNDMILKVTR